MDEYRIISVALAIDGDHDHITWVKLVPAIGASPVPVAQVRKMMRNGDTFYTVNRQGARAGVAPGSCSCGEPSIVSGADAYPGGSLGEMPRIEDEASG